MTILSIQKDLQKQKIDARLITLNNHFIGQDVLDSENQILKLTNFSGSYGILFITQTKAYLFVDGRYEIQAKKEVNLKKIEIVKLTETPFNDWLKKNFNKKHHKIEYNPWTITLKYLEHLNKCFPNITFIEQNDKELFLDKKTVKTFTHQKKFSGLTTKEKIEKITYFIKEKKLDAYLVTSATNSSWLLNMRSDALPYTPILRAYTLINKDGSYKIFTDNSDLKEALPMFELKEHIKDIKTLGADFKTSPSIILTFNPNIKNREDPISTLKTIKNKTEIKGFQSSHIRDGVAVTKFLIWLSKNYSNKTELDIAEKLLSLRSKELNFYSESFKTISAYGSNGAIVHYHPTAKTNKTIKKGSLLLLDSGAQYYDGTTDITRTIAIGKPTLDMIEKNTLVLKAHISLANAVFPQNTYGSELDILARLPLLKQNINYDHGTGHGVGHFSSVHEGSHSISLSRKSKTPLEENMITSIEPGYYLENNYGIRIENLYYITKQKNTNLLNFEPLTLVPIDKTLINKYLLTKEEELWINNYHSKVFKTLKKYLSHQELNWLKEACSPL